MLEYQDQQKLGVALPLSVTAIIGWKENRKREK